jgi:hypothetical protein
MVHLMNMRHFLVCVVITLFVAIVVSLNTFTEHAPSNDVLALVKISTDKLKQYQPFEDRLDEDDIKTDDKLQVYYEYIDEVLKGMLVFYILKYVFDILTDSDDIGRVQITCERAITDFPLEYQIWNKYLTWMNEKLKVHEVRCFVLLD